MALLELILKTFSLKRFKGNRFNIVFSSAASVFFLADEMTNYLQSGASNRLLKAVQSDLQVPEYIAGCKALGLVSQLITVPLWTQIEDTKIHILDIGESYKELVYYLKNVDYHQFIKGENLLSYTNDDVLNKSEVYKALIRPWEHDDKVIVILQILLPALLGVVKRLLSEHLEGGKWDNPSDDMRPKTQSTPKHNKFSESVFGFLDRFERKA